MSSGRVSPDSCKTATNDCKGQNSCKGQGFKALSAKACKAQGGSLTPKAG